MVPQVPYIWIVLILAATAPGTSTSIKSVPGPWPRHHGCSCPLLPVRPVVGNAIGLRDGGDLHRRLADTVTVVPAATAQHFMAASLHAPAHLSLSWSCRRLCGAHVRSTGAHERKWRHSSPAQEQHAQHERRGSRPHWGRPGGGARPRKGPCRRAARTAAPIPAAAPQGVLAAVVSQSSGGWLTPLSPAHCALPPHELLQGDHRACTPLLTPVC